MKVIRDVALLTVMILAVACSRNAGSAVMRATGNPAVVSSARTQSPANHPFLEVEKRYLFDVPGERVEGTVLEILDGGWIRVKTENFEEAIWLSLSQVTYVVPRQQPQ